ncbi:MAG: hypothetical protein AAF961_17595 [Planctomycetota bacterium]
MTNFLPAPVLSRSTPSRALLHGEKAPTDDKRGAQPNRGGACGSIVRRSRRYGWLAVRLYARCASATLLASAVLFSLIAPQGLPPSIYRTITVESVAYQLLYLIGLAGVTVGLRREMAGGVIMIAASISMAAIGRETVLYEYPVAFDVPPGLQAALCFCGVTLLLGGWGESRRSVGGVPFRDGESHASGGRTRRRAAQFSLSSLMLTATFVALVGSGLSADPHGLEATIAASVAQLALPLLSGLTGPRTRSSWRTMFTGGLVASAAFGVLGVILVGCEEFAEHFNWQRGGAMANVAPQYLCPWNAAAPYYFCLWNSALLGAPLAAVALLGAACGLAGGKLRHLLAAL